MSIHLSNAPEKQLQQGNSTGQKIRGNYTIPALQSLESFVSAALTGSGNEAASTTPENTRVRKIQVTLITSKLECIHKISKEIRTSVRIQTENARPLGGVECRCCEACAPPALCNVHWERSTAPWSKRFPPDLSIFATASHPRYYNACSPAKASRIGATEITGNRCNKPNGWHTPTKP